MTPITVMTMWTRLVDRFDFTQKTESFQLGYGGLSTFDGFVTINTSF